MPTAYDQWGRCRPYTSFSGVAKERGEAVERASLRERETNIAKRKSERESQSEDDSTLPNRRLNAPEVLV